MKRLLFIVLWCLCAAGFVVLLGREQGANLIAGLFAVTILALSNRWKD